MCVCMCVRACVHACVRACVHLGAQVQIAHDNRNLNAGDEQDGKDDGQKSEHVVEAVLPVPGSVWLPSNPLRQAEQEAYLVTLRERSGEPDGTLGRKNKKRRLSP